MSKEIDSKMVKIIIENLGQKELIVQDVNKSVLYHFHSHYVDWMHACGGKGLCTTCKMEVQTGMGNLGELSAAEKSYRNAGLLGNRERLACEVRACGDISVRVPDESKLPHVEYT